MGRDETGYLRPWPRDVMFIPLLGCTYASLLLFFLFLVCHKRYRFSSESPPRVSVHARHPRAPVLQVGGRQARVILLVQERSEPAAPRGDPAERFLHHV